MEFDWDYAEYVGCDPWYNDCSDEIFQLEDDVHDVVLDRIFSEDSLRRIVYLVEPQHARRLATALALIGADCMAISFDGKVSSNWRSAKITRAEIGYKFNFGMDFIEFTFTPEMWRVFVYPCRKCCSTWPYFKDARADTMASLRPLYKERKRRKRIMISRAVGMVKRYLWTHAPLSDDVVGALADLEMGYYTLSIEEFREPQLVAGGWTISHATVSRSSSGPVIDAHFFSPLHIGSSLIMRFRATSFGINIVSTGRRDERWRRARDRVERRLLVVKAAEAL